MLEAIIRSSPIRELWEALAASSDPYDRLLRRNLETDLRLNDPTFDLAVARDDITEFFIRWHAKYQEPDLSPKTFREAYRRVLEADNTVTDEVREWAYRRLFLLGYDTSKLHPSLCGRWVGFVKYFSRSETTIAKNNRGVERDYRLTKADVESSVRRTCRYKKFVSVASHEAFKDDIARCEVENGRRRFDALRNRLGLDWAETEVIVGLALEVHAGEPLARVPTFFDACGYPFFRPADESWYRENGCGRTCPIDAPQAAGVGELVVWVGDNAPPAHTGATGSKRDAWSVLEGDNGELLLFAVKTDPDLNSYINQRV